MRATLTSVIKFIRHIWIIFLKNKCAITSQIICLRVKRWQLRFFKKYLKILFICLYPIFTLKKYLSLIYFENIFLSKAEFGGWSILYIFFPKESRRDWFFCYKGLSLHKSSLLSNVTLRMKRAFVRIIEKITLQK